MPSNPDKVAVITGGASGMGLDVAQALAARGGWQVHVVDVRADVAPGSLPPGSSHHRADTAAYGDLAGVFRAVFEAGGGRLDFVFANAGAFERASWYHDPSGAGPGPGPGGGEAGLGQPEEPPPPPEPDWSALDTNLKGCVNTVRLAGHYMARSPGGGHGGSIVVTSSIAGVWPSYFSPIYTASKHGVVGFVRSVAEWYYTTHGIRVNAICPSIVRTGILPDAVWDRLPAEAFTPLGAVRDVVLMLVDDGDGAGAGGGRGGGPITDSGGTTAACAYGLTLMPSGGGFYLVDAPAFCDGLQRAVVERTRVAHMRDALG